MIIENILIVKSKDGDLEYNFKDLTEEERIRVRNKLNERMLSSLGYVKRETKANDE